MKKKILFFSLFIISKICFSQDTLVMYDNQERLVKIISVSASEVKYKSWNLQQGPDFSEKIPNLKKIKYSAANSSGKDTKSSMTEINYARPDSSATPPEFEKIGKNYKFENRLVSENRMFLIMMRKEDTQFHNLAKRAKKTVFLKKLLPIGAGVTILSGAMMGIGYSLADSGNSFGGFYGASMMFEGAVYAGVGICMSGIGAVYTLQNKSLKAKAIKLYNQKY